MKIVRILGGLGNQMFQYAFYLSLLDKGFDAKVDINQLRAYKLHNGYELEKIFDIHPRIASYSEVKNLSRNRKSDFLTKFNRKFFPPKSTEYLEKKYSIFDENVYEISGDTYYQGYWHNEKYFLSIKDIICRTYTFNNHLNVFNNNILEEIKTTNSVSIHIRRGDYINHKYLGNICSDIYYFKAISIIQAMVLNPVFYVFSDDIEYCKKIFHFIEARYITWNIGTENFYDMYLMSKCEHNIIANSSFSWWGAWLNRNPQKLVICPSIWNKRDNHFDNIPDNWLKI